MGREAAVAVLRNTPVARPAASPVSVDCTRGGTRTPLQSIPTPTVKSGPPPELRFKRRLRLLASLREFWRARELVRSLAERELRVRYKQAILGVAWAVITPLLLMAAFTLVFPRVATVSTDGVPYPLFVFLGLLPWTFFSTAVSQGGQSLLLNISLLNKVYCPREVFPVASAVVAGIDSTFSVIVLGILFVVTGFAPHVEAVVWVPVLLIVQVAFALGAAMVVAAVMVYLRDLRHVLPIALQFGLFATPVALALDDLVPARWQQLYVAVNPLAGVIDGYRRSVLLGLPPRQDLLLIAAISAAVALVGGYALFKRLDTGFADVA
jgi:ABC-type polysaccharide/polyol phosphate export permease